MSEYAGDTDFLESIIKIEPEEFETIEQKVVADVLEPKHPEQFVLAEQNNIEPATISTANSEQSRGESVQSLSRKGNEGKRAKDPHSCCICKKVVSSRHALKDHLENVHLNTNQMFCDLCPKIYFTRDAMIRHLRIAHGEEKFTCNQCDYKTARKPRLKSHKLSHAAKTECPICSKPVTFLKNHMRDHKTKVPCSICQKLVPQRCMEKHKKTHRNHKCGDCKEIFESREDLRRHKLRRHFDGELHECHCGSVFRAKNLLKQHQRSHTEGEETTCNVCQEHFSSKETRKRHCKNLHCLLGPSKEKVKVLNTYGPFICDKCGTKLSSRESFQHHILNHRRATIFCDLCPRSFHQKCFLANHMIRDHLKLRPFQCNVCQYKAVSRCHLELHKLRHGPKTECQVCHKSVANMAAHLKTHIKVKCPVCSKMCSKVYLRQHLKKH